MGVIDWIRLTQDNTKWRALVNGQWTVGYHKMLGVSRVDAQLVASRVVLSSIELESYANPLTLSCRILAKSVVSQNGGPSTAKPLYEFLFHSIWATYYRNLSSMLLNDYSVHPQFQPHLHVAHLGFINEALWIESWWYELTIVVVVFRPIFCMHFSSPIILYTPALLNLITPILWHGGTR
jgi:hypothetical protein